MLCDQCLTALPHLIDMLTHGCGECRIAEALYPLFAGGELAGEKVLAVANSRMPGVREVMPASCSWAAAKGTASSPQALTTSQVFCCMRLVILRAPRHHCKKSLEHSDETARIYLD